VLAYLGTVSEGIQGKIEDIGQAIVDDLDKILFAIQNPGKALPEISAKIPEGSVPVSGPGIPPGSYRTKDQTEGEWTPPAGWVPPGGWGGVPVPSPENEGSGDQYTIIVNGSIYASDFPAIVEKSVIELRRRGSPAFAT